jgi:uncharacterized membrane protein
MTLGLDKKTEQLRSGCGTDAPAVLVSPRLVALDLARVLAILFMIQGHALDVLLAPQYRQGVIFDTWLFLRGLTAPFFFSMAGISFMLSSLRHWQALAEPSWRAVRRLGRFSFFILLGYAMHVPAKTLADFQYLEAANWHSWWQVDVLQCIGLTLIALQSVLFLAKTPMRMARWSAAVGGALVLTTPLVWLVSWENFLPAPAAAYFTGAMFPLFPWAGYVFLGCAAGYFLHDRVATSKPLVRPMALSGMALFASGIALIQLLLVFSIDSDWRTSPAVFLIRTGCVCLLLAAVCYVFSRVRIPGQALLPFAKESLLIYFVHLCVLYGSIWNDGMRQLVGPNLDVVPTLIWIGVLSLAMALLAWSWNWLKRTAPARSYAVRFAVLLLAVTHPWT